jgi:hypothetical protein
LPPCPFRARKSPIRRISQTNFAHILASAIFADPGTVRVPDEFYLPADNPEIFLDAKVFRLV